MDDSLIKFLNSHIQLNDSEIDFLVSLNLIKSHKKRSILLREGEIPKSCFFVLKGCIRTYSIKNGDEIITGFYTENQSVIPSGYTNKTPSNYFVDCTEDSIISTGNPEKTKLLFDKIPKLEGLSNILNQAQIGIKQQEVDDLISLTAEERYLKLLKEQPTLLNRVPQYMIASYLGIKPQSLSRIRARIEL